MLFMLKDWALAISLEQLLRLDLFLERELSWSWHCHRSMDSTVPVMPRGFWPCQILNGHFLLISQVQIFALLHNLHFPLINTRINTAMVFAKDWFMFKVGFHQMYIYNLLSGRRFPGWNINIENRIIDFVVRKTNSNDCTKTGSLNFTITSVMQNYVYTLYTYTYIHLYACRKYDHWQGIFCLRIFKVGERYPAPTQNQRARGGNLHPLQSLWIMARLPGESLLGAGVMATQGSHPQLANLVNRSFCMLLHTVHTC